MSDSGRVAPNSNEEMVPGASERVELREETKCRDWPCLALFVFLALCMWTLSGWSYYNGYPPRLQRGWDIYGNVCDYGKTKDRGYTFFPIPMVSMDVTICLPGCPVVYAHEALCLYDEKVQEMEDFGCFNSYMSKPFYNKYCLPSDYHQRRKVLDFLISPDQVMSRVVGDMARAWDVLAIASLITGAIMVVYMFVFRVGKYTVVIFYAISVPVVLFLLAVLCFLIYEEWWRVDGKICDPFGPVDMEECDEGQNADGYQGLCWFVISVSGCVLIGLVVLLPKLKPGMTILAKASEVFRHNIQLHGFVFAVLVIGVVFYAYFITLLIYQVSCGDSDWQTEDSIPQGEVWTWDFHQAERVLVFFDVGMILWHFSFLVHAVEYVCAFAAKSLLLTRSPQFRITRALYSLFRYHLGSVLLASVIVPIGRLPRNLLLGIKSLFGRCPIGPFSHMTSDGLCYQAILGGGSYFSACRKSANLFKRQEHANATKTVNSGNYIVWVYQLLLTLVAPVFVMYWIQHKNLTFRDKTTREISSVIGMGIYALFFSWFLGGLFACFVRGLMHGSVIAYLADAEVHNKKVQDAFFPQSMREETFHPSEAGLDQHEHEHEAKKPLPFAVPPITQEEQSKDVEVPPPSPGERARQVVQEGGERRDHASESEESEESSRDHHRENPPDLS